MASCSRHPVIIGVALAVSLCWAEMALGQVQPSTRAVGSFAVMTTEERLAVERAVRADTRIRAIVGEQPRITTTAVEPDKAEAEAFLDGRSATPPTRRVTVVLMNPQTNQAARALIAMPQNRVLAVESIAASEVPFFREDIDHALALAKADPTVRRAVGDTLDRYEILESGSEARIPYAAQALPMRSTDPRDVCSVDRCLDLIFRTANGYLPLRAHVNLTRGTVEIHGGGPHR